ncbi:MAG TPA: DUF485 domain-containing protein [Amycolatopsis sp.]|nr:DUF485 domain-containing protein [Amycolatopsis sp.]
MQHAAQTSTTRNAAEETGEIPALFGDGDEGHVPQRPAGPDYPAIQDSAAFGELRGRFRRFAFPMTALFVVWYLVYVLLAAFAPAFMSIRLVGSVNVAIVMGILQFVSTAAITVAYLRYAKRRIDPQVEQVRRQAEA